MRTPYHIYILNEEQRVMLMNAIRLAKRVCNAALSDQVDGNGHNPSLERLSRMEKLEDEVWEQTNNSNHQDAYLLHTSVGSRFYRLEDWRATDPNNGVLNKEYQAQWKLLKFIEGVLGDDINKQ